MPRKKYKVNVAEGERVSPNAVYDYLIQKGVPHNHALGMMANIKDESNFVPTAKGDLGTSAGLFQHHNERYSGLKKHVNNDLRNWKGQIDYALNEGDTKSFLKKDFKSPEQASHWFTTKWERPQDAGKKAVQRQVWIKTYLDNRGKDYNQNLYNPENINPFEESETSDNRTSCSSGMCGYVIPEEEKMKTAFKKDLAVAQEEQAKLEESEARQELAKEEEVKQKKQSFIEELAALNSKKKEEADIQTEDTRQQPGKVYLGNEGTLFQPIQAAQQVYSVEQARDGGYFGDGGKKYSFPERDLYKGEDEYFYNNPHVGGMATEDNYIIINPYSKLNDKEKDAIRRNEASRLAMRNGHPRPSFELTSAQKEAFKNYSNNEQDQKETLVGRILSGDPSAGDYTPEQRQYAEELSSLIEVRPSLRNTSGPRVGLIETSDTDEDTEEFKNGGSTGIPDRYKNLGFTKVGQKKKSTNPGKKWMVLAKKGDQYKVVHGGDSKMQDFSQHHDPVRKKAFWDRMGGINGAKAKDPFSPLYWHKRFGTW